MIYADTDFFVALLKESDWLKESAKRLFQRHRGDIWTSSVTVIELMLIAKDCGLDIQRMLVDIYALARVEGGDRNVFLLAAHYIQEKNVNVFDALHAASCGRESQILSSDKVFDRLGLKRVPLHDEGRRRAG